MEGWKPRWPAMSMPMGRRVEDEDEEEDEEEVHHALALALHDVLLCCCCNLLRTRDSSTALSPYYTRRPLHVHPVPYLGSRPLAAGGLSSVPLPAFLGHRGTPSRTLTSQVRSSRVVTGLCLSFLLCLLAVQCSAVQCRAE